MEPDIKQLLEANLELSRENNEILKKIRNAQRMAQIYRFLYWIVIIGASYGAYYFVQPYIGGIFDMYNSSSELLQQQKAGLNSGAVPDLKSVQGILNGLQK